MYSDRELRVLELFRAQRRGMRLLAFSRCAADDRLLAAVARFSDGLWAWHCGSRLSPKASRQEVGSWYLDLVGSEELSPEIYRQAEEFTDRQLAGTTRYETPASVVKLLSQRPDEVLKVGPWRGDVHALQFFSSGMPLLAPATCGCRRNYSVQMLALVLAGVAASAGCIRSGIHIKAMRMGRTGRPADDTGFAYAFNQSGVRVMADGA